MEGLPDKVKAMILDQIQQTRVMVSEQDVLPGVAIKWSKDSEDEFWTGERLQHLQEHGYVVIDGLLKDKSLVEGVLHDLKGLQMKQAGLVEGVENKEIRGDMHMWLKRRRKTEEEEEKKSLDVLLERMEQVEDKLSKMLHVERGEEQMQATCYAGGGARYARHVDASRSHARRRLLTFIWYCNPQWTPPHGGQLRIFLSSSSSSSSSFVDIPPLADRLVVFQSRLLEHAVLPSHADRYAISRWMCEPQ